MQKLLTITTMIVGLLGGTVAATAEVYSERNYDDTPRWADDAFTSPE